MAAVGTLVSPIEGLKLMTLVVDIDDNLGRNACKPD